MFWLMLGLNLLVAMLGAAILFWPGGLRALRFLWFFAESGGRAS